MNQLPTDPYAFQARVFGAFCDDLLDGSFHRTNALREISKQSKRDGGGDRNPLPTNSGK